MFFFVGPPVDTIGSWGRCRQTINTLTTLSQMSLNFHFRECFDDSFSLLSTFIVVTVFSVYLLWLFPTTSWCSHKRLRRVSAIRCGRWRFFNFFSHLTLRFTPMRSGCCYAESVGKLGEWSRKIVSTSSHEFFRQHKKIVWNSLELAAHVNWGSQTIEWKYPLQSSLPLCVDCMLVRACSSDISARRSPAAAY